MWGADAKVPRKTFSMPAETPNNFIFRGGGGGGASAFPFKKKGNGGALGLGELSLEENFRDRGTSYYS